MTHYSQDDLAAMIERYNNELMAAYGNRYNTPAPPPVTEPIVPDAESEAEDTPSQPSTDVFEKTPVEEEPPTEKRPSELTDIGRLQVRVSTENEAVPIVGAIVTVTNDRGELMRLVTTNENGLTDIIELPTKDRALSLTPGNIAPYAVYTIDVTADGYFQKRFTDLPIYGGVTAIQSVAMIPLPEAGDDDIVLQYPQNGGPTML